MQWLVRIAQAAVVLTGAALVVHSIVVSFGLVPLFPYLDHFYLQGVYFYLDLHGEAWRFPFRLTPSNEHLMLFPMPLYWLDNVGFRASGALLVSAIHGFGLLVAVMLGTAAGRTFGWTRLGTAALVVLFAAAQAWYLHGVNLFWPKQVHMYCMLLSFVAGALVIARADAERSPRRFAVGLLLFAVSLFSFGYGLAACAGMLLVVLCRAPWRWSLPAAGAFALLAGVYWLCMEKGILKQHVSVPTGLDWLLRAVEYGLYYLSSPVRALLLPAGPGAANVLALAITGLGGLLAVALLVPVLLRRGEQSALRTAAAILVAGTLAGVALTTVARLGNDPEESRADRYAMVPVLFWDALLLLLLCRLRPAARAPFALATAVVVLPLLVVSHRQQLATVRDLRSHIVAGEMAALNDVADPAALAIIHPSWRLTFAGIREGMHRYQWGVFAGPQDEWLGRSLDEIGAAGEPFRGAVLSARPVDGVDGRLRVEGAAQRPDGGSVEWLVLCDAERRIVGVAHGQAKAPGGAAAALPPGSWWVGYAPAIEGLRAFAIADGAWHELRDG